MLSMKVRGLAPLKKKIDKIPRGARGAATEAAAFTLIGNQSRGLQHYPTRKLHGAGNPYVWQSEKQRRAFFATKGFGRGIPTKRTFNLRFGWKVVKWGDGVNTKIVNDQPYADFVQGEKIQAGHIKDGWKTIKQIFDPGMMKAMMRAVDQAVGRYLKKIGL